MLLPPNEQCVPGSSPSSQGVQTQVLRAVLPGEVLHARAGVQYPAKNGEAPS